MLSEIIRATSAQLPDFNDYLLKTFRKEQLDSAPDFISVIFEEAIKPFRGEITYLGYVALTPEERTVYELNNEIVKGRVNIRHNEWILYRYDFMYRNMKYNMHIYLPYFFQRYIVINNTQYNIQLAISEKVFTKINDGITAKVVRSPIKFWRNKTYTMVSVNSGKAYFAPIITMKAYNKNPKQSRKAVSPTIVHYLLCKYGLSTTLTTIFGIDPNDVHIVDTVDNSDTHEFEYFDCRKTAKNKPQIYMKVRKKLLEEQPLKTRVIASVLYLLNNFRKHTIEDLHDPTGTIYRVLLGKIIHGTNTPSANALNYMNNHMLSLNSYLDPITRNRLRDMGIHVQDIYDLFIYIFKNIDHTLVHTVHSDLYDKRIDILDTLLVSTIVKAIYYKFYAAESKATLNEKHVSQIFKINSKTIVRIYDSRIVRMNPSRYNDNWLLSVGSKKMRLHKVSNTDNNIVNAPEHRFHPSFGYVESLIAFSQANPGSAGTINPFLPIDNNGFIVKEPYSAQFDEISKYLPYQTQGE